MNENDFLSQEQLSTTSLEKSSWILQHILAKRNSFMNVTNHGSHMDPTVRRRLERKYPNLKGITVSLNPEESYPHGMRSITEYSIYYRMVNQEPEIVLIDQQDGNYVGGTNWIEGQAEEIMLTNMEDIYRSVRPCKQQTELPGKNE